MGFEKFKWIGVFCFLLFSISGFSQKGVPYRIYNAKGKAISFDKMTRGLKGVDVVLFGEFHDNSLGHWLELELLKTMHLKRDLIVGAEMFEVDNQDALSAYLMGILSEDEFLKKVRLWDNYKTDYRPLVEFAKENKLSFVATNVPRRYASQVYKLGVASLDSISDEEKLWMAPLPFPYDPNLPGYKKMMTMFDDGHVNENLPRAQAIKDATMAYFINKSMGGNKMFVHFNGAYHSDFYEGIVWYLKRYNADLRIVTISMVVQEDVFQWKSEDKGRADFVIVIDRNISKTF